MTHLNLQKAIQNKETVAFTYLSQLRIVEPYMIGLNEDGEITLKAWQMSGGKKTGWMDFFIDKIRGATSTGLHFEAPRAGYASSDTSMQHILTRFKAAEKTDTLEFWAA